MGWKIVDDVKDWKDDLSRKDFNQSSILYLALTRSRTLGIDLNEAAMLSFFMDQAFINDIYSTIKQFYLVARNEIADLKSGFLTEFIDREIDYHQSKKEYLTRTNSEFYESIINLVKQ